MGMRVEARRCKAFDVPRVSGRDGVDSVEGPEWTKRPMVKFQDKLAPNKYLVISEVVSMLGEIRVPGRR